MSRSEEKIAIVGGGPCGSSLALILAKHGYNVDLFEKREDASLKPYMEAGRSFNLSVSVRALRGWERAGVKDEIVKSMVPMRRRCVHMPDESTHYYPYGKADDRVMSIRRRYIQEVLAKKIKTVGNITTYFNANVHNVNLKETTFDFATPEGHIETKKYD
jgi:kynurenine 3-monooxygenase